MAHACAKPLTSTKSHKRKSSLVAWKPPPSKFHKHHGDMTRKRHPASARMLLKQKSSSSNENIMKEQSMEERGSPLVTINREMTDEKRKFLSSEKVVSALNVARNHAREREQREKEMEIKKGRDRGGEVQMERKKQKEMSNGEGNTENGNDDESGEHSDDTQAKQIGKKTCSNKARETAKEKMSKPSMDARALIASQNEPQESTKSSTKRMVRFSSDISEKAISKHPEGSSKQKESSDTHEKKRKLSKHKRELSSSENDTFMHEKGVMYLGHIPHGFYEREIRGYFNQFGEVSRVRLSRSKKTARSRGYAFVEFQDAQVAEIAARAMDGYLLMGRALVANVMPKERIHEDLFKGANTTFKMIPRSAITRRKMKETAKVQKKISERSRNIAKSYQEKVNRLKGLGFQYAFPEISG